jgi:putative tryptophan/tyrosine transport system substrate-binding protein
MRRREFIAALGGAAAWPLAVRAQQPKMPVIGFLRGGSPEAGADTARAFRKGLDETGYVEGRNVVIEYRWSNEDIARLPELARDLVSRRVAVIATPNSTVAAVAAKAATRTTPIVFGMAADPVQIGLVASLNRPGGNVTGINSMNVELEAKRLGLLHELLPRATRFAVLVNPTTPNAQSVTRNAQAAAATIGLHIEVLAASNNREIDMGFASLVEKQADALLVSTDVLFESRRAQFATLAAYHRVPAIYWQREFAEAGGLMSYGSDLSDQARQVGIYTGRILNGEKPADLPIRRATKFELVINLHTAKLFGLTVPPGLLAVADEVIE